MRSLELDQIRSTAEVADTLLKRYEEDKALFYVPCCQTHKLMEGDRFIRNNCPVLPCPDSKYAKFHLSQKRIRVVFGSNRSSKSYCGANELLMRACYKVHPYTKEVNRQPGKFRIYGSDFGVVEKVLIPLVKDLIPKKALKEVGESKEEAWEKSWDNKYHILYLKGGTTLDFMSYDQDLSKSESIELDGVWADEEMPEDIYNAVLARLISRQGYLWITVTPMYKMSWAMKFLDTPETNIDVFQFHVRDNPYISGKMIDELAQNWSEHEKVARLDGKFMEFQGLVYKELRPDIHLIDHDEPKTTYPVVFALDPHPRKATVGGWAYVTPKGDVVFFDEIEVKASARDTVYAIRDKEAAHGSKTMLRLIDPASKAQGSDLISYGTDTLQEFEKEGMFFTLADNSEAGYNAVHEYLTWNPNLPVGLMNRPQCFFTRNVPKIWYGMTHLLWDEWNMRKSLRDDKERVRDYKKDYPDIVRYVLAMRPTYRSFSNINAVKMNLAVKGSFSAGRGVRPPKFQSSFNRVEV